MPLRRGGVVWAVWDALSSRVFDSFLSSILRLKTEVPALDCATIVRHVSCTIPDTAETRTSVKDFKTPSFGVHTAPLPGSS